MPEHFRFALKASRRITHEARLDGAPRWVATTSWGYPRLRLEHCTEASLAEWAARIAAAPWREAHVYFVHEPAALSRLYEAGLAAA